MKNFKVGDKIRRIDNPCEFPVGTVTTVTGVGHDGWLNVEADETTHFGFNPEYFELVEEAPKHRFKVGDRVRRCADPYHVLNEGVEGTVVTVKGERSIRVKLDSGRTANYLSKFFVKADSAPTPRVHAELIKQWAEDDSLEVQFRPHRAAPWFHITTPSWDPKGEYRIKPEVDVEALKAEIKEIAAREVELHTQRDGLAEELSNLRTKRAKLGEQIAEAS